MPVLKNPRHEHFAQAFARHANGTKAAIEAGYAASGASVRAAEFMRKATVIARINELRQKRDDEKSKQVTLTRDWVIDGMKKIAEAAIAADDRPNAIRALQLLGNETGAFIATTKLEVKSSPLDGLSTRELRDMLALLDATKQVSMVDITQRQAGDVTQGDAQPLRALPSIIDVEAIEIIEETGDDRDLGSNSDAAEPLDVDAERTLRASDPPPPGSGTPGEDGDGSDPLNFLGVLDSTVDTQQ
jgi:phage terminase small subunit